MTGIGSLEPSELDEDSRMQYMALNLLEEFNRRGWVEDCPRVLLTNAERKFIGKMQKQGLASFTDEAMVMALTYVVASIQSLGHRCKIDLARRLNEFRSQ